MGSMFKFDLACEHLLQPFLDKCYAANGIHGERCRDRVHQKQGIDIVLSKDGCQYLVDEKAQLNYLGCSLPTFALEINYLKKGEICLGWLFDESKTTEVYAFVFDITLQSNATELRRTDQVIGANIVLVNRQRLLNRLVSEGLDRHLLSRFANELRETKSDRRSVHSPGLRVMRSARLTEEPVNLLVTRRFLESIGQVLHPCQGDD